MTEILHKTPLHALHVELGGKMVPFAGYDMPVQYPLGIMGEHKQTREKAGLFDVSHMGQARYTGDEAALEALLTCDLALLGAGEQKYTLLLNEQGGIRDDLMVSRPDGDGVFLIVNAAMKDQDFAHLAAGTAGKGKLVRLEDRALLALQGPAAKDVMARLCPEACKMIFMQCGAFSLGGVDVLMSRSGYTGEDGFEISIPEADAVHIAKLLLAQDEVEAIGLGARDSLRLEAGLCLYGHDMDTTRTPVEASLIWALAKTRRERGDFPGAGVIQQQIDAKTSQKRIGLTLTGAPAREGAEIATKAGKIIGIVTSGGFGPTINGPVAMGYVDRDLMAEGTELDLIVRGKPRPATVTKLPFVPNNFFRG
ncbi:glycine cleavage system aminomethyltransferase GcvT [uncultured Maricaulis sp.]|uniref:glycine cleavage system aminomethyltransferase GcvT n=1 Tax=uncultured Maricaulis sp. TaxID=174710 RepID=UPI0030DD3CA9|tara:strand:+ start:43669 stop:44766 length:1098 start_codon:yes stop_codon:yes gene_type:complete